MTQQKIQIQSSDQSIPTYYVHGGWGGVGPRGEMIVYLYQDVIEFPGGFTLGVDPKEGVLKDEPAERPRLQRTVLARLIMPAPAARSLARWLDGQAEVLERS